MTTATPKRHHYVPACYLRAWADGEDKALVRRRDAEAPFLANVGNVASESGLYGRGADAIAREKMFGAVERDWPWLRERMTDDCHLNDSERELVAIFISLQFTRTRESFARREFVAAIAAYSQERPLSRQTVRRYLAERHLGFPPEDAEVEGAWTLANYLLQGDQLPTRDESIRQAMDFAIHAMAPRVAAMAWTVEICRKPLLITSDRPVMLWRPRTWRDKFEGIGVDTADEIRFPLTPNHLLVLRRGRPGLEQVSVQPTRFARANQDVASQCFEFVIGTKPQALDLGAIRLSKKRPALRFDVAPGVQVSPSGDESPMGDILHTWSPLRDR